MHAKRRDVATIHRILNDSFGVAWHQAECLTTCSIMSICSSNVEKRKKLRNGQRFVNEPLKPMDNRPNF
jgi:hypothetical protein